MLKEWKENRMKTSPLHSAVAVLGIGLLLVLGPSLATATTFTVTVGNGGLFFSPSSITIQPGDTIQWTWSSSVHSSTSGTPGSPNGIWDSGILNQGATFSHTFSTVGSFPYYCTPHGGCCGMTGTVTVSSPTPTPTPIPTATPTPTPITISGTISYCSNPVPGPVPNVTLTLTGTSSDSTLSDSSGNYTFSSLAPGGNYTVTPSKAARTPGSANINTVDVIAVQKQFLTGTFLSGCRLAAADVNGDSVVNTQDVIAVQRFFNGQTTAIANVGKYQFTPVNRTYTGLVTDQTAQNYDTLVFGDVAAGFVELVDGPSQTAPDGDGMSAGEVPATVATLSLPNVAIDAFVTNVIVQVTTSATEAKNKLVGFQGDFTFDERATLLKAGN